MSSKLSDLVDNLSEIYSKECKECKERKKIKSIRNFIRLENDKLHYKCKEYKKKLKPINGLIEKFLNTYQFCDEEINKFVVLLRKSLYPYKYLDSWK